MSNFALSALFKKTILKKIKAAIYASNEEKNSGKV
jgi:hypothetical protein